MLCSLLFKNFSVLLSIISTIGEEVKDLMFEIVSIKSIQSISCFNISKTTTQPQNQGHFISFWFISFSDIQVPHHMDLLFVPQSKGTRMNAYCSSSCWSFTLCFSRKLQHTYAIIDGSEIFIETPSDLHMQSSTWSQYKHHNTTKFLVACTPNGAICFVSSLYVGSITDVELTRLSGFLDKLKDKPGIAIMPERGFTVKDMLQELNIELNIPPFMEGRQQLPYQEVEEGREIASLRIHVERAIGRTKTFGICKGTIPISMARIYNQIVCVCAFLSNFQPALVPPSSDIIESDIDDYFNQLPNNSDDSSSDTDD